VYLALVADPSRRKTVSLDGGYTPRWRQDGRELFFLTPDGQTLMSVGVTWVKDEPTLSKPIELMRTGALSGGSSRNAQFGGGYVPVAGGQRFLVGRVVKREPGTVDVIVNWPRTLGE
jgi:hypothetical protein